eukprot:CAMPEP_0202730074 /NCGR_PEP_ID=MMETSP1385-20130828/186455_1 /ASSEMBLY_ACC=CAM_ASM_000861 /TAXON_ID=933848 /ORGANISM="Elphidium margaritaceum" /LENGTH=862 /DNA_ID=CAMNT_0049396347 /DNA_START=26 /DNA_END=2615 /DNA_ORIENTATION=+
MDLPNSTLASSDDILEKYENAKHLLHKITDTFNASFQSIQQVMTKYPPTAPSEFISELSSVLEGTRTELEPLFKDSSDPGLFVDTAMEQQLAALRQEIAGYQQQKQQGMQLVKNLQAQIESLSVEKSNWSLREQKGKKLIDELKREIEQHKNGTYSDVPQPSATADKPLNGVTADYDFDNSNSNNVDEKQLLEQDLQTYKKRLGVTADYDFDNSNSNSNNVEMLLAQISQLNSEKQLLEQDLQTYKKRLSATGGNAKHLVRKDTKTDWQQEDLEAMKEELRDELLSHHQAALNAQFERSWELRTSELPAKPDATDGADVAAATTTTTSSAPAAATAVAAPDELDEDAEQDDFSAYKLMREESGAKRMDRVFRDGTTTQWDEDELSQLKQRMKEDLAEMVMQEKQAKLTEWTQRADSIRDVKDQSTAQLIEPHGYEYNDMDMAEEREQLQQKQMEEQQHKEAEFEAMEQEMFKQKQSLIGGQFERNYNNVTQSTADHTSFSAVKNDQDLHEMEAAVVAMKKSELMRKTELISGYTEPQLQPQHRVQFLSLMKDIGIVNNAQQDSIWHAIDETVNGDKRAPITNNMHSITASTTLAADDGDEEQQFEQEMDAHALSQLHAELRHKTQELATVSTQLRDRTDALQLAQDMVSKLQSEVSQRQEDADDDDLVMESAAVTKGGDNNEVDDDEYDEYGGHNLLIQSNIQYETPRGPDPNEVDLESADQLELRHEVQTLKQEKVNLKSHYDAELEKSKRNVKSLSVDNERLQNEVQHVNELRHEVQTLKQEKVNLKSHYDAELEKSKRNVKSLSVDNERLQNEVQHVKTSKIALLQSTSKEIDSLRRMLGDYVKMAKQLQARMNPNGQL